MKRTDDRNAERRADYRVNKRKEKRAKQFAAKIVGFLNGTLKLCFYMDIADSREPVPEHFEVEGACCRWLADRGIRAIMGHRASAERIRSEFPQFSLIERW